MLQRTKPLIPAPKDGITISMSPTSVILEQVLSGSSSSVDLSMAKTTITAKRGSNSLSLSISGAVLKYINESGGEDTVPGRVDVSGNTVYVNDSSLVKKRNSSEFWPEQMIDFTVTAGGLSFNMRFNIYVNNAGSLKLKVTQEVFNIVATKTGYSLDGSQTMKSQIDAEISASATRLTSQFTEQISRAGADGRNLFGFAKGVVFGAFQPFIQGYGILSNVGSDGQAWIHHLGFEGKPGAYTVTFQARMLQQSRTLTFCLWGGGDVYVERAVSTSWQYYELHFNITTFPNDTARTGQFYIDDLHKNNAGVIQQDSNWNRIAIRHLKIERSTEATNFCEADEDVAYLGQGNVAKNLDFRPYRTEDAENQTVDGRNGVYRIRMPYLTNTYPWGDTTDSFRDYLIKSDFFNLEAGKCYTLSFWAKSSVNGFIITQHLYKGNYSIINSIGNDIYVDPSNGTIQESIMSDGQTQVKLSTTWTQYFVHFYVANNVPLANVIPLRVQKSYNNSSARNLAYIYMSDIELQEGYVTSAEYFASFINQNARRISLVQQSGTKLAGVDIQNGMVNLMGDRVIFSNSTGTVSGKVWIDPDNGTIHATDGDFSGKVTATSGVFTGNIYAKGGTIGGFTIDDTGKRFYNSDWGAGIDINYDGKTVKIGKNAQGASFAEDAIIHAENTKTKGTTSDTYNTALYLNAAGAKYNYAFYGNGNGVLNGLVFGYKVQLYTIPSVGIDTISYLNIIGGSTIILNGSHDSGIVSLAAPKLPDVRKCLGINSSTTPFAIEFTVISHATYNDVAIIFRTANSGITGDNYLPWLMNENDVHMMNDAANIQIAQGDVVKILLVYDNVGTTSNPNYEYRAYDLIRRV